MHPREIEISTHFLRYPARRSSRGSRPLSVLSIFLESLYIRFLNSMKRTLRGRKSEYLFHLLNNLRSRGRTLSEPISKYKFKFKKLKVHFIIQTKLEHK